MNRRGQVTIFIIIAIILVAGVAGFFLLRNRISFSNVPAELQPAYDNFLSCLEDYTLTGSDVLESQAGYIYLPNFESGSQYMPFSSQLDFLGNAVPYWYYVSGNNVQKEQVPSKSDMETQLAQYVEEKIKQCSFKTYTDEGVEIIMGEPKASVNIKDGTIDTNLDMPLELIKGEDDAKVNSHKVEIDSNLGRLYNDARKIYDSEQKNLFLENYAIDNLRLYAPVDGVEVTCAPEVWKASDVFDNLRSATETNTMALKTSGEKDDYFLVDVPVDEEVRFINSKNWEYSLEVNPAEGNLLIASPVGNQPGLGILGFCYVPYHFVYNMNYPVLVQIIDGDEIFQFPLAVVIRGNQPREPLSGSAVDAQLSQLCEYKNTPVSVSVKDTSGNPLDAYVSFECFGTKCNIGETENGQIDSDFPQCANGYVSARVEGYSEGKQVVSTVNSGSVSIFLDKLYDTKVNLYLDGKRYDDDAIVTFISDKNSRTIVYPGQTSAELSEGQYEVSVSIYKNKSLTLESGVKEQCVDVPRSGVLGVFGMTEKKCMNVEIPEQTISQVLVGGGKENYYILENDLKNSDGVNIYAESLTEPSTIEDLQENYILYESKGLDIVF